MKPFRASEEDWQTVENGSQQEGAYIIVPVWRTIRELRDRVAALEASAAAAIEPPAEPPDAPQTLHTVALAMVDILERLFPAVLHQIVDTIRRAIREPMVATGEGPVPTDEKLLDEHWDPSDSVAGALRSAYNLGRQHATTCPHIRQGDGGSNYCDLAQQVAASAPLPPLAVGQMWRRRDGEVVKVTRFNVGWHVGGFWYDSNHKYARNDKSEPHEYDLIELVSPAPAPAGSPQVEVAVEALQRLRRWGGLIGDRGHNADVITGVVRWIDDGMVGSLPPLPDYIAARATTSQEAGK